MTDLQNVKKYITNIAIVLAILFQPGFSAEGNVVFDPSIKLDTPEALAMKEVIENSFRASTDMKATEEDYARYHSTDYIQHVDGKILDYNEYVQHRNNVKKTLKSVKVVFHDIIIEKNKIVTRHTAYAVKNDDIEIELQVIAIFEIKDGKIISCNELTHLAKGERPDRDLGSR